MVQDAGDALARMLVPAPPPAPPTRVTDFMRMSAFASCSTRTTGRRLVLALACVLVSVAGTSCDSSSPPPVSANRRRFDSLLAHRDTAEVRIRRSQDSMLAAMDRRSVTPETPAPLAVRVAAAGDSVAARMSRAADSTAGATPQQSAPALNAKTLRARAMGESIATAAATRRFGSMRGAGTSRDTVRGIIAIEERANRRRPVLKTDGGRNTVTLGGIAADGLGALPGVEVVVRGSRVSSRDIIVASFLVRAMQGVPAFDGRLISTGKLWALELTDASGFKQLTEVPALLQQVVGERVWVSMPEGTSTPRAYGVIGRR